MPARRRALTEDGDYTLKGGVLKDDPGHVSQVILRIRTKLGTCVVSTLGSRFHELPDLTDPSVRLAERFGHECVADLVAAGAIRNVVVACSAGKLGRLNVAMDFTDTFGRPQHVEVARTVG